jgi:hypothetical protein
MLNLDRLQTTLAGVAAGLLIAVFYLRGSGVAGDLLKELSDGAILLMLVSFGLSFWQSRVASKQGGA